LLSELNTKRAILQPICLPQNYKVNLFLLRLDLIDEEISGNKWFKLKYNLQEVIKAQKTKLITFGGAFSNHIAATAKACSMAGIKSIGIIRGENVENHTLQLAASYGMELKFVSRNLYSNKDELMQWLSNEYNLSHYYIVPEGGGNQLGIEGCKEIVPLIDIPFDFVAMACGTGTTLSGVVQSIHKSQVALGFAALKGGAFLVDDVNNSIGKQTEGTFAIIDKYHFGGYAKHNIELINFIKKFELEQNTKLDFVYTAKMMYGIYDLIQHNYFPENATIVAIHSGGLQGNIGIGI
jgi:1-aminocyclopropane-1-carboxylate deaminase